MIAFKRIRQQFIALLSTKHLSVRKIALSWAIGSYIAFSPFPGGHTIMMFGAHYLFKLHFPLLFIATSINNPWTMIPCYFGGYWVGHWIVHGLLGYGPLWEISLSPFLGSGNICLWSFFIGGNVLGIAAGLISYPIMLSIARLIRAKEDRSA